MRGRDISVSLAIAGLAASLLAGGAEAVESTVSGIRAGHLIDVTNGKVLGGQVIVVRDGRIDAVGSADSVAVPPGAKIIDLGAYTVLPGLIDTHTHITSDPTLPPYAGYGVSVPRMALKGAAFAQKTLLAGVTTIRDVGASGYSDVAVRDAINDGDIPG